MPTIWTHDLELRFLETYQCYPIIWDPKCREHKDRNKVHDAWNEISGILNISIKELKSKKDSLMTTFRMHKRKIKSSEQSGAGSDDIYTPIWFAFSLMDSFLGDIIDSNSNKTKNTITVSRYYLFLLFFTAKIEVCQYVTCPKIYFFSVANNSSLVYLVLLKFR